MRRTRNWAIHCASVTCAAARISREICQQRRIALRYPRRRALKYSHRPKLKTLFRICLLDRTVLPYCGARDGVPYKRPRADDP
jgi:hypothetical protein